MDKTKIIFLDVDGVLNSLEYFYGQEAAGQVEYGLVDPDAVERLSRLVRETGAELVLSSSWREGWSPDPAQMQPSLSFLCDVLASFGLKIIDKTPAFHNGKREEEILYWLSSCEKLPESFVILDDAEYSWNRFHLNHRWVQTDFDMEGLGESHIKRAKIILEKRIRLPERLYYIACIRKLRASLKSS